MREHLELMGFEVLTDWGSTFLVHHPLIKHENCRVPQTIQGLAQAHRWLCHATHVGQIGRESAVMRSRAALAVAVEAA